MKETWKDVGIEQFRHLYEISSLGKVRVKNYRFYKNGELHRGGNQRILTNYDKQVFLSNGLYRGFWKIGVLFNETYKNK